MIATALLLAVTLATGGQAPPPGGDAFARAVALQQAGDREGAVAAYRELLKTQPANVQAAAATNAHRPFRIRNFLKLTFARRAAGGDGRRSGKARRRTRPRDDRPVSGRSAPQEE